jgi:hypothetical protein
MAYQNLYEELAGTTRDLYSQSWYFDGIRSFPDPIDTEALLATAQQVVVILGSKSEYVDGSRMHYVRAVEEKLKAWGELESLVISYVCGRPMTYLRYRCASPRTAGLVMSMNSLLDRILTGSTEAIPLLLEAGKRLQAHVKTLDPYILQGRHMSTVYEFVATDETEVEMMQRFLREFDDAADAIWVYGAISGASWA